MKNRIFLATGYFNIISIIATIKTIEIETTEKFNDILVIINDSQDEDLLRNIANKLYNFSKIIIESRRLVVKKNALINFDRYYKSNNLTIDEFFIPSLGEYLDYINSFNFKKNSIIYEGRGSLTSSVIKYTEVSNIYLLSDIGFNELNNIKLINQEVFKSLIIDVHNYDIFNKIELDSSKEAIILLVDRIDTRQISVINKYQDIIKTILTKYSNCNLYIKPHPRQNNILEELNIELQDNIHILKQTFLAESLFSSKNIKFCLSNKSSSLLMSQYVYNIPSFYFEAEAREYDNTFLITAYLLSNFEDYLKSNITIKEYISNHFREIDLNYQRKQIFKKALEINFNISYKFYEDLQKRKKAMQKTKIIMGAIIFILLILLILL